MAKGGVRLGTRSVLFTDLVGSTELRVRVGEDAADELRRAHDALVSAAVIANGGTVLKGLGDGVMATFESAGQAVAASVAVQQAADAHGRKVPSQAFSLRVGLSIGDVSNEDGDVFGVPVVEASRLCAAAAGGEVLAAELVRALARGRGGFVFEPMGDLLLKGLAEPVSACRVLWEPLADPVTGAADAPVPIAAALLGAAATSYVGREGLRERLTSEWHAAQQGGSRTILLAGEPGVGKTRTAAELARLAHAEGALVLFGRCDEDLGVPYQPFVEALEHYIAHAEAPALGRFPGELRRLVPDLGPSVGEQQQPVASDPASEEHRLFEACASWLSDAANAGDGLVLVLDDVHWATKPTLQLLQHVVRNLSQAESPVLVLATYRDTDVDRSHPLAASIGDLRRLSSVDRVTVDNLSSKEVHTFIETAAGHALDAATRQLAQAVHAETEGNPFFVGEVLRHLVETGGVRREGERWVVADPDNVTVPEGVRDVVGRRLNRLSQTANEVLSVAAVIGRDFDVAPLMALLEVGDDGGLDALDEAVRARLVEETVVDRYRFSHALVRTTLYEELSATRRRRLHRRVADVLEKMRPDDVRALAYHCTEAGPDGGNLTRAVRYTLAAANEALAARAFADAEVRFRGALELLDDSEGAATPSWVAAMCGLGESLRDQGDPSFREVLLDAAHRALELADQALVERATLSNNRGMASIIGGIDPERVRVIEQALELVGPAPGSSRCRLLALLASELTFSPEHARRLSLSDQAVAMARALDDDRLLGDVLATTGYAAISGTRTLELVERNAEATRLADRHGDPTQRVLSRVFYSGALLTVGRFDDAEHLTAEMVAIAEVEGSPIVRWFAAANALRTPSLGGRLDEALRLNDAVLTLSGEAGQSDGEQWWGAVAVGVQWLRGEVGDLADAAGDFAEQYPLAPVWRCAHAWVLGEAGRYDEAQMVIRNHALDPAALVIDPISFVACFQLCQAAFALDDAELGARAVEALGPHRELWAHFFMFVVGPISWALGLAQAAAGDLDQAVLDLGEAMAKLVAVGMLGHVPTLRMDLALVLRKRRGPGDAERATELLGLAREEAALLHAEALVAEIERMSA